MLKVFIASTDIADMASYERIRLSDYRIKKIERLRPEEGKKQSKAAGLLLAYALKESVEVDEYTMEYDDGVNGKPFFRNRPEIYFNVTHTRGICAVAISDRSVGIDAEYKMPLTPTRVKVLKKRKFFVPEEIADFSLREGIDELDCDAFYRLWTAKESAVKCSGDGIGIGFNKVVIPYFTDRCECSSGFITAFSTDEHVISVCSVVSDIPEVEWITE